ncbi:MAG: PepSY domain-containing protein [Clostridia bacterium]|nr:PepSY domain-containing protein [Clostridia bacterium]
MKNKVLLSIFTAAVCLTLAACTSGNVTPNNNLSSTPAQNDTSSVQTEATVPPQSSIPAQSQNITVDKAKEIALQHAGVSSADAKFLKAEYDFDDGVACYDVEFKAGGYEYDYEINAQNGNIIKSEKEIDD